MDSPSSTHPHTHKLSTKMAHSLLLPLTLCLLFLSVPCFAQRQGRFQTDCQIDRLNAQTPQRRIQSEAGVTEVWDLSDDQFKCAGVAPLRHRLQPRGLLLPHYDNAPHLIYVVRGRGVHGPVFPGCAETFQSQSQSQSRRERGSSAPRDQHQKIGRIREGDVIAIPAGTTSWVYNDGDSELVLMLMIDVGNFANQLDQNFRRFFLAGSPRREAVTGGPSERERESESEKERRREGQIRSDAGNLLSGFDVQLLAEAFNIDPHLARRLQNRDDMRGSIVSVDRELDLIFPEYQEEEQERRRGRYDYDNGLEETFCTMRLRHRLDQPSQADVFNPHAGRITTVNSFNLPVLRYLQLSAERGVLYRNAIYAPHWNKNAHSIVYITRGNGHMQIVREDGETVFNGPVEEGQLITVPQHFAVLKRANEQGLEWVAFKTNGNARISQVAGRVSVLRAIPVDVLSNSFRISREEARRLKENRDQEVSLFSPTSRFSRYAIEV